MALDPLPPDAQALIDHCERQGYHGAPLPTDRTADRGETVTRIFYDTEFIEDGRTIDLISIGMVREDTGAELYLVNADMPVRKIRRHDWLMANVVPGLPKAYGDARIHMPRSWLFNYDAPEVQPRRVVAEQVRAFILGTPDPQLWAWYGAYDHVVLAWLFGPMSELPAGIPMWTNDLRQEAERLGNPALPEQGAGIHNALADARHNMARARALDAARGVLYPADAAGPRCPKCGRPLPAGAREDEMHPECDAEVDRTVAAEERERVELPTLIVDNGECECDSCNAKRAGEGA